MKDHLRFLPRLAVLLLAAVVVQPSFAQTLPAGCARQVRAEVVAFDQVIVLNRLGAMQPQGMIYALRGDVVPISGSELTAGNVRLRPGKRPRPLVLRMNAGDCLRVEFQNLLNPTPVDDQQPHTRTASVHVVGMQLVGSIDSDGSNVGQNASSLAAPNQSKIYTLYGEREGGYLMFSAAAQVGGEGDSGSNSAGLFGAVIVEPPGAEWYRSQITAEERELATTLISPDSQPILDFNAVYPSWHARAGVPILKMLNGGNIIHSDLTAVITGPDRGRFPNGTFPEVAVEPDREQPFREFVTIYHDELGAVQAFPQFNDPVLGHTLHSVRDAFAINYGTGGIGAEILANRFGVGPMADCTECKFEDFFLSSWAVGDPAMIVDVPANAPCTKQQIQNNVSNCFTVAKKATKALFPDDPSNVYHSYLRDHVKFRVVHAGSKEHHIHHQHTHQWLFTPDEDDSSYLDSQAVGPGSAFTLEIAYGGSGNRNLAVGDSIFHCHFYPHFAQGMWALWRVHDVFEWGTPLDEGTGEVAPGNRALPDGEIAKGTPIPAIVPLPTLPMPPLPVENMMIVNGQVQLVGPGHRGYPFFVPGIAGHRPPHPPLDTIDDGGLPRHVIEGGTFTQVLNRFDFSKELVTANAKELPETGTAAELDAMAYHAQRQHPTYTPEGDPAFFITNGLPPKPGAPYADPCVTDAGAPTGNPRLYKSADIQLDDIKFNKVGWHFQQQRISALWDDVAATRNGTRPPEPLFFRANSRDCIEFQLVNLIPGHYEQDDFQVRTPTDIVGQHIHLVKFDVTASDGAANGFNYEDGSFSPDDVIERIEAINAFGGLKQADGSRVTLAAEPHPFFGTLGAQTTVQRWYADEVLNNEGEDRTLRTVFTHDHFGPSTHQQVGLYAGLVVEPQGSTWKDPKTGNAFGGRFDGGPTSWRADIVPPNPADSYREFLLEFADFQHAYKAGAGFPNPANVINPPGRKEVGLPFLLEKPDECPGGVAPPCPEAISADDVGTMVLNYRNEPLALRVHDPGTNTQAAGLAGDLSFGFRSDITRAEAALNSQPTPLLTPGMQPGDPYTPLLEAYENDRVQIRILVGAHEEGHNFTVHGVKWLFEPSAENSGFRNSQMMGISEHFEFVIPAIPTTSVVESADFLYTAGRATDDLWNGLWGIMRAYKGPKPLLNVLPNNVEGGSPVLANPTEFLGICPTTAPQRNLFVTAVRAKDSLPGKAIVYNPRPGNGGSLEDPSGILYVRDDMLDPVTFQLKPNVPVEPLVLRANAGDCINLTLTNRLPSVVGEIQGYSALPMLVDHFNTNQLASSPHVGLHPQLVYYDVTTSDGHNVGFNPTQTAAPGQSVTYKWYAGELNFDPTGILSATPIEFGSTNLMSSDPIRHAQKGGFGALIIEPPGSVYVEDSQAMAVIDVNQGERVFYENVVQFQTDVNLVYGETGGEFPNPFAGDPVRLIDETGDPEDSGHKAVNYRSEQIWHRMGNDPDTPLNITRTIDFTDSLSNALTGDDPHTPIFITASGIDTRFRILTAGGHARNNVFALHGHVWQQTPYVNSSHALGDNPLSEWTGTFMGLGASSHFDALLQGGSGGKFMIPGDYLYRSQQSFFLDGGLWGILRVHP